MVRQVDEPSNLSGWSGIPHSLNIWIHVPKFAVKSRNYRNDGVSTLHVKLQMAVTQFGRTTSTII